MGTLFFCSSPMSHFLATAARRRLTVGEEARLQAHLAGHPELQAAWEEETGLNRLLEQLPAAPVSSNFTAQVLLALDRESCVPSRPAVFNWWQRLGWQELTPRVAMAGLVLCVGLLGYWQHQVSHRTELAKDVYGVGGVAGVPTVEMLKNFEAINRLHQAPQTADLELLAALK